MFAVQTMNLLSVVKHGCSTKLYKEATQSYQPAIIDLKLYKGNLAKFSLYTVKSINNI